MTVRELALYQGAREHWRHEAAHEEIRHTDADNERIPGSLSQGRRIQDNTHHEEVSCNDQDAAENVETNKGVAKVRGHCEWT